MYRLLLLIAAWSVAAHTQTPAAPSSPVPKVILESADGEIQSRPAAGFETEDPRQLGARIIRFEGLSVRASAQDLADSGVVELARGDRLYGRIRGGRAELLDVEIAGPLHVGVSVDEVKSLIFPARIPSAYSAPLSAAKEGDRLYRRQKDGLDRIDGGVEEFTSEGVRFHSPLGSKLIPWLDVAALYIEGLQQASDSSRSDAKSGAKPHAGSAVPVVLDLVDHSRLRGNLKKLTGEECRWTSPSGAELAVPNAVVAQICVDDGSITYLSALSPALAVDSTPFGDDLGMRWPHRIDLAVTGSPLTAGGRVYARGIGVHSPSRITWKLDGGYKMLRGSAAVDDQVLRLAARGSVVFRILVDGAKRWESALLRGGDPPIVIPPQNLAGAHELALEVDMADDSFVADRADWLDVILVRG
jgi:NPCBM/NEW2 domain